MVSIAPAAWVATPRQVSARRVDAGLGVLALRGRDSAARPRGVCTAVLRRRVVAEWICHRVPGPGALSRLEAGALCRRLPDGNRDVGLPHQLRCLCSPPPRHRPVLHRNGGIVAQRRARHISIAVRFGPIAPRGKLVHRRIHVPGCPAPPCSRLGTYPSSLALSLLARVGGRVRILPPGGSDALFSPAPSWNTCSLHPGTALLRSSSLFSSGVVGALREPCSS